MADSEYPYPPDEFDREAATASLYGAHRAEHPFWRQNLVYLIVIAAAFLVLLVLLFSIVGMGRDGGGDRADAPTTTAAATETTPPAEESSSAAEEPAAEPDRARPVVVINAGGINGMAGAWRDTLEGAGWTSVDVATADSQQEEAVVFYRDEADAATAQALAQEVGAGEARQSDEYDNAITFVAVTEPGSGEDG
ncbi:LytR C-terminal domain-containing protein [Brachybacterium hainanense]|uniref:LytR C-terminal domain-containing protein n=1 Tax=Brachybacterium hainanense TaxID=1541174 RepID=A0ABV6RDU3_9MICO